MATSSSNLITTLGAGSGVDVKSLAQSLVDAEKQPRKALIDTKITKSEARVSGYGAVSFVLGELKKKFSALDDLSDFSAMSLTNSQSNSFAASTSSTAVSGTHSIEVLALATAQRRASAGFAASTTSLNNGAAFNLNLTVGTGAAQTIAIAAGKDTPAGIVSTINGAKLGVTAQLVNTGDATAPYKIVVTGKTGAANSFTLSSDTVTTSGLNFGTAIGTAADASLKINGVSMTRPTNSVDDAIPGVTLSIKALSTGEATLDLNRDTSSVKTKLQDLVSAYNDVESVLSDATNKDSKVEGYGASLVGDSLVQKIRSQVRGIFTSTSSTPGTNITALRDVGITITKEGKMELDATKADTALATQFDDMVKMLSQNRTVPTTLKTLPSGLAGDAVKTLDDMINFNSSIGTQTRNTTDQIAKYKTDLQKLDERMTLLLSRYNKQFSAMDGLVGQTNSMKTSLKSTFEGMMAAYTNK
jgi:flagellar hook-associated protein 2